MFFCHQFLFIYLNESHYDLIFKTSCGKNLGSWVNNQKKRAEQNKTLKPERLQLLEEVGLLKAGDYFENKWQTMYSSLKEYKKNAIDTYGAWDGNVPQNHVASFVLFLSSIFY